MPPAAWLTLSHVVAESGKLLRISARRAVATFTAVFGASSAFALFAEAREVARSEVLLERNATAMIVSSAKITTVTTRTKPEDSCVRVAAARIRGLAVS